MTEVFRYVYDNKSAKSRRHRAELILSVRYFRNLSNIDDRVRNISWQTLNLTQTLTLILTLILTLTLNLTIYIHIHIHGHLGLTGCRNSVWSLTLFGPTLAHAAATAGAGGTNCLLGGSKATRESSSAHGRCAWPGRPRVAVSTSAGIDLRRTTTGGQRRSSPIVTDSAV